MSEIFIQTFFLYFIVIDPLGNTPLFLSITQNMDTNKKIRIALSATIIASIILLFFALLGSSLLSYLNISYPAFTIGGGIILLIIAIEMLFDKRQQRKEEDIDLNSDNISVFPLATPIIAGPAAITSVIVSVSDIGTNFTNQSAGMLSLVLVLFLTFIIFFIASKFSKIINKKIISVISRVVAIILVGLSVQYILDGIKTFFSLKNLIKSRDYFWNIIFKIKKTFITILPRKLI
ncbi:MarC family protein [Candidatus Pelagibacter sp.]|nr:MarC family protein [Candidatus Pelagibacter sp.]